MANKHRFFMLQKNGVRVIFEIKGTVEAEPMSGIRCKCCEHELQPAADVCQLGMFDDSYITYMVCFECGVAWEYRYQVANYSLMSKREQKQSGLLLSKRIPPTKSGTGGE